MRSSDRQSSRRRERGEPEPGSEKFRLFIAVPVTEAVRAAALARTEPLHGLGDVRWVAPENLHLTLKFLGAAPADRVPAIREELANISNNYSQFVVSLAGVSAFPNPRRPRTLWLGLEGEVERLAALAAAVEEEMAPLGFPAEERGFRPHLTVGRVRSPRGLAGLAGGLEQVAQASTDPVSWPVTEFHLVRSALRPSGPEYTTLERFPLVSR